MAILTHWLQVILIHLCVFFSLFFKSSCYILLFVSGFFSILMGLAVMLLGLNLKGQINYIWILFGAGALGVILSTIVIYQQPQSQQACTFKVPILPIVAALSTSVNIILMLKLGSATWIRFGVWMVVGENKRGKMNRYVIKFRFILCSTTLYISKGSLR